MRGDAGNVGFEGLVLCGSVWACPPCAAKIAAKRAAELQKIMSAAMGDGDTIAMLTLTLRHWQGQPLRPMWDDLLDAWRKVMAGEWWAGEQPAAYKKRLAKWHADRIAGWRGSRRRPRPPRRQGIRDRYSIRGGPIKAAEVTCGDENGWHPHLHVVLILEGHVDSATVEKLRQEFFARWRKQLAKKGREVEDQAVNMRTGYQAADELLSMYLVKAIALEVTQGQAKKGRQGGRTPFQLLSDAIDGDDGALGLWREFEAASFGRAQLTISPLTRELYGLGREQDDDEIVEEEPGDETFVYLPGDVFDGMHRSGLDDELLRIGHFGGPKAVIGWLDRLGVPYVLTDVGRREFRNGSSGTAPPGAPDWEAVRRGKRKPGETCSGRAADG